MNLEHFLALYPVAAAFLRQLKSDLEYFKYFASSHST